MTCKYCDKPRAHPGVNMCREHVAEYSRNRHAAMRARILAAREKIDRPKGNMRMKVFYAEQKTAKCGYRPGPRIQQVTQKVAIAMEKIRRPKNVRLKMFHQPLRN